MPIGDNNTPVTHHVRFMDYTGKWPNLCGGVLTLMIDGKTVTFGNHTADYPKFWSSGGRCGMRGIEHGEWKVYTDQLPEQFRKYASEIDRVINENIEHGCCGGCR